MQNETVENNPAAAMHAEVMKVKNGGAEEENELPRGETEEAAAETLEADGAEGRETPPEETPEGVEPAIEEPEDEIRIGDQVFKSTKEAIAYAERIEREKLIADAHTAGVREALEAQMKAQAPVATEPEEDTFEQDFYSNPKETLKKMQAQARDEAIALIKEEQQREKTWSDFLTEYPDIRRKDAERILQENWETIGKMTDLTKGKQLLAQKVRAEYAEIAELYKPRTALSTGKVATMPSGGAKSGVTPKKDVEKPLSFAEQLRKLR